MSKPIAAILSSQWRIVEQSLEANLMALPFYTIGHSTRTIEEFVELLRVVKVKVVADIRSIPGSRANPQFNGEVLPETLAGFKIGYAHIAELGGLRNKSKVIPVGTNGFWEQASFRNYADYALTPPFREGLVELIKLGRKHRCAMMCAEAVWWRCHRRIVTDHLLARGESVFHLMNKDTVVPASLTVGACVVDGSVTYPPDGTAVPKPPAPEKSAVRKAHPAKPDKSARR